MEIADSYSAALAELQTILADLQAEQVGIDQLTEKVQRAAALIAFCQQRLQQVETDLQGL